MFAKNSQHNVPIDIVRSGPHTGGVATVIFALSLMLDARGAAGGSIVQYVMAAINSLAFLLLAINYKVTLPRSGFSGALVWVWLSLLLIGSMGALVYRVPFNQYIRVIYPFILFLEGFLVAWWVSSSVRRATLLVSAMTFAAIVSLFFTIWWGFHFTHQTSEEIRYQILSPMIPFLVVVAAYDLVFARKRKLFSIAILVTALTVIGLSVTRSMLLVIGMVVAALFLAAVRNWFTGVSMLPKPIRRSIIWGITLGVFSTFGALFFAPDFIQRWVFRSLSSTSDITLLTRVAAVVEQWNEVVAHPGAWFLGLGFGHSYHYALSFASTLVPYVNASRYSQNVFFPAEFMWIAPLYYGGFIVGVLVIMVLLGGAIRAFKLLCTLLYQRAWRYPSSRPLWVGALGFFAFIGMSYASDPFIIRLSAMYMGLTLGLCVKRRFTGRPKGEDALPRFDDGLELD